MDAPPDIMESAKPPKPPRPGRASEPVEGERSASPLLWTVVACAVATAVFTGITAWETHQDRVNTEVIYCTIFTDVGTDDDGEPRTLSDQQQRLADQLGC
jgi:hypothetical protein